MMLDKPGLYVVDSAEAERIAEECRRGGWLVMFLPTEIASKEQFFDAIRSTCPLDPPLHSNRSWDALADSLWSGLDELERGEIAIFWLNSDCLKVADPEAFAIATDILTDLCTSLADPNVTASRMKTLLVFQTPS
ncbi:barstar family protein [Burkholderia sp. Tr-20390]|uniref:barstar family protein n=1 Tax=Burkholderia sp. Tr-20390 TaxID=2703904 RepID=UPI0019800CB5|nr:barstar family protein [Burkholderia sp. Tr-20390]MBN3731911.1 barstar family protein [Burkholderia sp. Tr-20390]